MEQFKSLLDDFVATTKKGLVEHKVDKSKDVLMGLMLQYIDNLVGHTQDQKKYEDGLWQKTTNFSVDNVEIMSKRCLEIAALCFMLYEGLQDG